MIDEDAKTLWCGNLSEQVTEELLYELFLQAGPLEKVRIPRERDGRQKNFAFITFCHEVSVPYAIQLFRGTTLFNRSLTVQSRNQTVPLPPPIRCNTEHSIEFPAQLNIRNQFAEMTDSFDQVQSFPPNGEQDRLSVASLQGNWSRHHPYRKEERDGGRGRHGGREGNDERREGRGRSHHAGSQPWEREHSQWDTRRNRRDGHDRYNNYSGNGRRNR